MNFFLPPNPLWFTDPGENQINSIGYSIDGRQIAFSKDPGTICIASIFDGQNVNVIDQNITNYPAFDIKFHPAYQDVLIATFSDGHFVLFNTKGEIIKMVQHHGSQLLFMDVDSFGEQAAMAYADASIRLYDLETLQRTVILQKRGRAQNATQTQAATSLIFHQTDSNIVLSSTALDRVLFWDIRTGSAERYLAGPLIRGPGLSIYENTILTVSCRDSKPLEFWDFGSAKKIKDLPSDPTLTYFAGDIAPNGMEVVVASSSNLISVYDFEKCTQIGRVSCDKGDLTTVCLSPHGSSFVVGSSTGSITCFPIRVKE